MQCRSVTLNWMGEFPVLLHLSILYNFYLIAIWNPAEGEQEQITVAFSPCYLPEASNSEFVREEKKKTNKAKQRNFYESLYLADQLHRSTFALPAKLLRLILESGPFKKQENLLEHGWGSSLQPLWFFVFLNCRRLFMWSDHHKTQFHIILEH